MSTEALCMGKACSLWNHIQCDNNMQIWNIVCRKKKTRLYYKWLWTSIVSTPRLIGKSLKMFRSKHIHHADDNDKWYMYMYPWYGFFFSHIYSLTIRPRSWIPLTRIHIAHSLSFLINFTPKLNSCVLAKHIPETKIFCVFNNIEYPVQICISWIFNL